MIRKSVAEPEAKPADKPAKSRTLRSIVGHCPSCGAPIYGHTITDEEQPQVRYACFCVSQRLLFVDTVSIK